MAETDLHAEIMIALKLVLRAFFSPFPNVYVGSNLLVFYERGNRRRHVSPGVFLVRGVPNHMRDNFLIWQERHGPQFVLEVTSDSTRREDQTTKFALYRDVLKVREYFLFDPRGDWLAPPLQGHRLWRGEYRPIAAVEGRLPSRELGLHLDPAPRWLHLWDPATRRRLPTPQESLAAERAAREQVETALRQFEQENARLRLENEELRRRLEGP
jgi:hypothetical protein